MFPDGFVTVLSLGRGFSGARGRTVDSLFEDSGLLQRLKRFRMLIEADDSQATWATMLQNDQRVRRTFERTVPGPFRHITQPAWLQVGVWAKTRLPLEHIVELRKVVMVARREPVGLGPNDSEGEIVGFVRVIASHDETRLRRALPA